MTVGGDAASDLQARRDFVAGKILISRRSIEASGVTTVQELLKREPSVTVGADGRLGLIGLPGYTQLLVDGKPPLPGRHPLETDLVHIERIEIVKGSLAEYGPFGIAGTINIVSRRVDRKPTGSLRLGGAMGHGLADAHVAASKSWRPAATAWSLSGRIDVRKRDEDLRQRTTTEVASPADPAGPLRLADQQQEQRNDTRHTLTLGGTLSYKASASDRFELSPSVLSWRTSTDGTERHAPGPDGGSAWPDTLNQGHARMSMLGLPLSWEHQTAGGSRLELEASVSRMRVTRQQSRLDLSGDMDASRPGTRREISRLDRHATDSLRLDFYPKLGEAHALKLGVNLGRIARRNEVDATLDGVADPAFTLFGGRQSVRGPLHSAYVQDEWTIGPRWAATAGISAEWRRLRIEEGALTASPSHRVVSPSLHLAHKIDAAGTRRLRLSLARSFRAPAVDQLLQRPTVHPLAPCAAVPGCGPNTVEHADTAGNPELRPERAWGVTATYEQDLGKDSLLSIDLFQRQLRDLIGERITHEAVPWSSVERYVVRPVNLGAAWTRGLSVDARLSFSDLAPLLPKLELRAGATLARSRLNTVPGPDNRMADQSPWSAKLGARYTSTSLPLQLSLDASWTPGLWVRSAVERRVYQGRRQELSAQATWNVNPAMTLRLNANKLLSRDSRRAEVFGAGDRQDAVVWTHKEASPHLSVQLEMKI
ncbi:TonB-dependent receptor [Pelomonas sp. CA6]|uniref:TonB-dependent receptor plug domain-containing protein n=1 Tax=Pelomonas sp. CA6 TaxID=2907999 RepID=UPI001F4A4734|nr:TonB-dependent receptor [Pelomonas sp. CA6]MCH7342712.1 TonB-dependent receptor [Pelomonas sp. CA6]